MKQFIFFFLLTSVVFSQSRNGFVYQKGTSKPIPFATIKIGGKYEIITDNNGAFIIQLSDFNDNDTLKISRIGYEPKAFLLKNWKRDTLFLQEKPEELNNFFVMNKQLSGDEIMERVIQNMDTNYLSANCQFSVFQRLKRELKISDMDMFIKKANFLSKEEIKNINQKFDTLKKISKNVLIPTIYENTYQMVKSENKEDVKWNISECFEHKREGKAKNVVELTKEIGKTYFSKLDTTIVYRLKTGIFPVEDSLSVSDNLLVVSDSLKSCAKEITDYMLTIKNYNVIKNYKDYKFNISKIQRMEGEPMYILTFQPNKFSARYTGTLYVSADTYAVTRLECNYAEGKNEKVNLKFLMGLKYQKTENKSLLIYKKQGNYYFPIYGRYSTKSNMYINRNFKLIGESKIQQDNISKIKVKLDIIDWESSEYIFKNLKNISKEEFERFN